MTDEAEINLGGHKVEQISRTEYSVRNTTIAFAAQSAAILMGFVTRVVFTRTLSEGYVGINGLFTDILNILSLSELGVGTAITYALYGPIAKKDIQKQQVLMRLFKNFYRLTAAVVLLLKIRNTSLNHSSLTKLMEPDLVLQSHAGSSRLITVQLHLDQHDMPVRYLSLRFR